MFIQLQRKAKHLLLKLLRLKDSRYSISIGFTAGFLVNFIPTFGVGPIVSTAAAKLVRGNAIAGLVGGVSFMWLFPFLFYLNFLIGDLFLPAESNLVEADIDEALEVIDAGIYIGKAFFIGMVVNMLVAGIILYSITFSIISRKREHILKLINKHWQIKKGRTKKGNKTM